jgi:hypothetical protein
MKYRIEQFNNYVAQQDLVKQAEQIQRGKRNNFTLVTNLVRIVLVVLRSLR